MNSSLALIPSSFSAPIGSLDAYIAMVSNVPLLTPEEELQYAEDFQTNNNLDSARKLVLAHLRFVVKIARGYDGYGLQQADLIQEGNIGLMKAVKRFDPKMGVRLVTFAVHWIKSEIHDFIIRNWRIVKIATTKAQRKLFFNLRRAKKSLTWLNRKEINDIAQELKVPAREVQEMEMRMHAAHDADIHFEMDEDAPSQNAPFPLHYLADANSNPALVLENEDYSVRSVENLQAALMKLDTRSQDILKKRWLQEFGKATLEELAQEYGISCERVRQLEKNAMKKLAQWMR